VETDSLSKKNIISFRNDKTHHREIPSLLKRLNFKERLIFWGLFWLFLISIFGLLRQLHLNFLTEIPKQGGSFTEGLVGRPAFINPVLALSDTDKDLSMLIYSGLLRATPEGDFIPDLAKEYTINEDGSVYTVTLKDSLTWHDETPVTVDDIIFTINKIKDPLIKSPLRPTWEGVSVFAKDEKTVEFRLEQPYSLFLENLTTGIIPKHIWEVTTVEDFINNSYNTEPTGSGPYYIDKIERSRQGTTKQYTLKPFKKFSLGKPNIKKITIKFYSNEEGLIEAFEKGDINTIGGRNAFWTKEQELSGIKATSFPLARLFAIFLNQSQSQIFTHPEVREALNLSVDKDKIVNEILAGYGSPINGPLPPGSLGFVDSDYLFSKNRALEILEEKGWTEGEDGIYEKETKGQTERLIFSIATANIPELKRTAELVQKDWKDIGVQADIKIFEIGDLNQEVIRPRSYDALLFGEVTGRDPDPFAFWHSSQRLDPGLNIALYTNVFTDKLLEDSRSIKEKEERAEKYRLFQKEVISETPTIFLYSPNYLYILPKKIKNVDTFPLTVSSERFINIHNWFIETDKIWNFLKTK